MKMAVEKESFPFQLAESALPQDQDLDRWQAFVSEVDQIKASSSKKTLQDKDYLDLMLSGGQKRKLSGRTPEVIWGHRKFQEWYFEQKKGDTFQSMLKYEMGDHWNMPFAKTGGTEEQKISLVNHLSGDKLRVMENSKRSEWDKLRKAITKTSGQAAGPKAAGGPAVGPGDGCSGEGPAQNTRSKKGQGIVTRKKTKAMLWAQGGVK